jgi:acyl carrier protein
MKDLVINAVKKVNDDAGAFTAIDENTEIFENFDSTAILELILELEDQLQAQLGRYVQIADENSMNAELTPFKTLLSLIEYVSEKVNHG